MTNTTEQIQSKCCGAEILAVGEPDDLGGHICTMHYECRQCGEPCDVGGYGQFAPIPAEITPQPPESDLGEEFEKQFSNALLDINDNTYEWYFRVGEKTWKVMEKEDLWDWIQTRFVERRKVEKALRKAFPKYLYQLSPKDKESVITRVLQQLLSHSVTQKK